VLAARLVALEAELGWMEGHAKRLGLDLDVDHHPAAQAYRRHLDRVLREGFGPAITTLWTLERTYLEAWQNVAPGAAGYREFVEHWTLPEFAAYVDGLARVTSATGVSEQAFVDTARLERDFWDLALRS
jgi:thiaminase